MTRRSMQMLHACGGLGRTPTGTASHSSSNGWARVVLNAHPIPTHRVASKVVGWQLSRSRAASQSTSAICSPDGLTVDSTQISTACDCQRPRSARHLPAQDTPLHSSCKRTSRCSSSRRSMSPLLRVITSCTVSPPTSDPSRVHERPCRACAHASGVGSLKLYSYLCLRLCYGPGGHSLHVVWSHGDKEHAVRRYPPEVVARLGWGSRRGGCL
mmetsp:Transcript_46766/g.99761  ORF Transcript_46766/g.99761 Transcript_46766/m.99761 type:complete len:213 (+) Transcript_46766:717-1355(+)